MKKEDFLKAVEHEVKTLKKLATKEELKNLNLGNFNPQIPEKCIYGQMTGHCASKRAKVLMDNACIIVTNINEDEDDGGTDKLEDKSYSSIKKFINGKNTGQGWKDKGGNTDIFSGTSRNYRHLSALEAYICLKGAKIKNIVSFLKGESETLALQES